MPEPTTGPAAGRRSRLTLILLAAVFAAPMVAAWVVYNTGTGTPDKRVNYGELISPVTLPTGPLQRLAPVDVAPDPATAGLAPLRGKWTLVVVDSGACPQGCVAKLEMIRKMRAATGKEADRVALAWLVDDSAAPAPAALAANPGLFAFAAAGTDYLRSFPAAAAGARAHVYIVDPLGNVMMRYPQDAEGRRALDDLQRLLRASQIGSGCPIPAALLV